MSSEESESSRVEQSGGNPLWNSIAGLLCCCTSNGTRGSNANIEAKETKSNGEKKDKVPKKKSKENTSSNSDDGDANLLQSEETLFGKQWFGYSRKVSKKGKSLKKTANLDDVGTESKPIDTNIMKAKLDVRQKQKRAPSALHMKRMLSNDVFDNNVPQDPIKEADEQPRSEANKTIPEENPVETKTGEKENTEKIESTEPPEQKEDGETKNVEEKPDEIIAKQENPAAAKEELQEVSTSASVETAKENTSAETGDAKKSNETNDVNKDVTETVTTSSDVTTTPDDAVKDAAVAPVDVKESNSDLKLQSLVKDTKDGISSSSPAAITAAASTVASDETLDSTLPPTKESPTNHDKESVLSNQENSSDNSSALPSELLLQPKEEQSTTEAKVLNPEASKNEEQASPAETKTDVRTENKNDDESKPEAAQPSEIKDEQEKAEKAEAEKEISSSDSHLPTEALIKAQET